MKRGFFFVMLVVFTLSLAGVVVAQDDMQKEPSCKLCGMDRAKFAHSRMFVTYDDGTTIGTYSIHCLAIDLAVNIDKTPSSLEVGDFNSKNLIDAEKAFWVIGGNKPGVMTTQAKWAFEKKEDAERFIMGNSGTLATFDEAMKATYESMYADTKMIREKRKMKMMHGAGHH
ncbi:MAG: nitrous oxide reductase accessory protein NosL [Proteobacteria bacterium]|nr:nitrous oxide reductase accessory protein NosL [Pseudomonadota bacterium]